MNVRSRCAVRASCNALIIDNNKANTRSIYCVSACPDGYYGLDCANTCSCGNGAQCDHVTGDCSCPPGWVGDNCNQRELLENSAVKILTEKIFRLKLALYIDVRIPSRMKLFRSLLVLMNIDV